MSSMYSLFLANINCSWNQTPCLTKAFGIRFSSYCLNFGPFNKFKVKQTAAMDNTEKKSAAIPEFESKTCCLQDDCSTDWTKWAAKSVECSFLHTPWKGWYTCIYIFMDEDSVRNISIFQVMSLEHTLY